MNLWSLLGVSVAVAGLFSIAVNELCRSQTFYDNGRWIMIAGFCWTGVVMFVVSRIRTARRLRRPIVERPNRARESAAEVSAPEAPFVFFSGAYWGVMFLIFGAIVLVIRPDPQIAHAAEEPPAAAPEVPEPAPAPAPDPITPEVEPEISLEFPDIKMQGVIFRQPNPSVLLNGRTYFVGDDVEGVRIISIDSDSVTLEWGGERRVLRLE